MWLPSGRHKACPYVLEGRMKSLFRVTTLFVAAALSGSAPRAASNGTPTIEQLLTSNWQLLEGTPFENFLAQVFDALGYWVEKKGAQTRRTQASPSNGHR